MKVVIVGGVAGGATAAARIRRLDEQAEIVVFERSGYISYANCGLPYYIGGVIEDQTHGAAVWRPVVKLPLFYPAVSKVVREDSVQPESETLWQA